MTHLCPMCGRSFEWENDFGARGPAVCPACGTAITSLRGSGYWVDPEAARQKVRPPAIALMIVGAMIILVSMLLPAAITWLALTEGLPPDADARHTFIFMMVALGVTGMAALAIGAVMIAGGWRMYHLRTWWLALTAAILATASFLACCVLGFLGLIGLAATPVGIWALVVLNDAAVRPAFR